MFGFGGKKTEGPKPGKKIRPITYRLAPLNYAILSAQERADMLRMFGRMIRGMEKPFEIAIVNRMTGTDMPGREHEFMERSAYITSKQDLGPVIRFSRKRG